MPHNNINALSERPEVLTRPKLEGGQRFVLKTPFEAAGDQPTAIAELSRGVIAGEHDQVLLGATGTALAAPATAPMGERFTRSHAWRRRLVRRTSGPSNDAR